MIRSATIVFGLVAMAFVLAVGVVVWVKIADWLMRRREVRRITRSTDKQ